jgi:ribosome-associated toxin RatA of RatAB toxin-antitoxin module
MVMVQVPFAMAAVMLTAAIALAPFDSHAGSAGSGVLAQGKQEISVTEAEDVYRVTAEFTVPAPRETVTSVLTDYERIPKFMPDVKTSQVLERTEAGLVVEQEAAATFMMFSKRIHLVLEVIEGGGVITFRDRCGKSFEKYEGAWRLSAGNGVTRVRYELTAKPSFEVPGFVLKRLLKRDAAAMIDRLTAEITNRGDSAKPARAQ